MPIEMFDHYLNGDKYLKDKPISLFNDYPCSQEDLNKNPYNFHLVTYLLIPCVIVLVIS